MLSEPVSPWQEDEDIFLLKYYPWRSSNRNAITKLLLDFKQNVPGAVEEIQDVVVQQFGEWEVALRQKLGCKYIVSIPSSSAEHPNIPCEQICSTLSQEFPWLTHLPQALKRTQTVPQSSRSAVRTDYARHMQTIQYAGPVLQAHGSTIIMIDDILTTGSVSKACRDILERRTKCKGVLGVFIGRTISG